MATWWSVLVGACVFMPILLVTGLPSRETWGLLFASVCVEVVYYSLLSAAYNDSDFSLVYPLARGTAPAFIALWSVLFLNEVLSPGGVAGLIIIILGLIIVGSSGFLLKREKPHVRGVLFALTIALLISVYTTIDGAAVRQTSSLPYAVLVFFFAPVLTSPLVLKRYGWRRLTSVWSGDRKRLIAIGLSTVCAYLLALAAFTIAPLGYSGAIREVSVVLGAFAGWRFLDEKLGGGRLFGSVIIFIGILLIVWLG